MNTTEFTSSNLTEDQKTFITTNFPNSHTFVDKNGEVVICTGIGLGKTENQSQPER